MGHENEEDEPGVLVEAARRTPLVSDRLRFLIGTDRRWGAEKLLLLCGYLVVLKVRLKCMIIQNYAATVETSCQ